MPPRAKAPKRKPSSTLRSNGGGFGRLAGAVLKVSAILLAGVLAGYLWRSFYPVALPFESPLVADKSSRDVETGMMADALSRRAREAEAERDSIARQLARVEEDMRNMERELADLKIKSVLSRAD